MKKLFLFFLIFIEICLVSGFSVYPTTINESTKEIIIQNHFDKEILINILNFEKIIQSEEKIIFEINEKTFSHNDTLFKINIHYENLNFIIDFPININKIEKKKKPFPIFIISSIIVGICVVIILKKF